MFRATCHNLIDNERLRFLMMLRSIVGRNAVLIEARATVRFRIGIRFGGGTALAVVFPGSLLQLWRVARACVSADKIMIMQAANTGLTGGSTPFGCDYDRDVVIINTSRIAGIHVIEGGRQVICLAGSTLCRLERVLAPFGREPHSVIGSSCIGASVVGGVCNNSGGALVRRGPAYTEIALFARVDGDGVLRLVNHLGVNLGADPEVMLNRLEQGDFGVSEIEDDPFRVGADHDYARRVRDVDNDEPARFNANPRELYEAAGSAGKILIFAVRLDTFPKETHTSVFYIGSNDPQELTNIRRHVLKSFKSLPILGEYIHRDAYNFAEIYCKDTFLAIRLLGTSHLPRFFRLKDRIDQFARRLGCRSSSASDRILHGLAQMTRSHLPRRMNAFRDRFEHHLILKVAGDGVTEAKQYFSSLFPSDGGDYFYFTEVEARRALLHRFAVAGSAIRFRAMHSDAVEDIVALDVALKRNETEWFKLLPAELDKKILHKLFYGHFFCHVFHQDYVVAKGYDLTDVKGQLLADFDSRGAEYPAEHNVGHLYDAKPTLAAFYRYLDPCNSFNPGIGHTSTRRHWR